VRRAAALAILLAATGAAAASDDFAYVREIPAGASVVIVDARALDDCKAKSLAGARCLPSADFLGPQRRLPDARNLLWLLGTAGLAGDERVLVVGQDVAARDFVAGLLHLAGQRSVLVLTDPVARLLASGAASGPGRERATIREAVFEAPMRDDLLVLRTELVAMRPWPMLLDGRTDREYWGETVRAARTGHLPGAISLPAQELRSALDPAAARPVLPDPAAEPPVAYAHDAYEGLAYLTLLAAGHGVRARLYAEGWSEWAADGALPADALGFRDVAAAPIEHETAPRTANALRVDATLVAALALVLAAFAFGRWSARRRRA